MPDYEQKPLKQIAGIVGRDPEVVAGDWGEFTKFSVAVTRSYGDDGETRWYGVTVNKDALQEWVKRNLHKGSRVVCEGVPKSHDYQGEKQHDFAAFRVGLVDWAQLNSQQTSRPTKARQAEMDDEDEDL